MRPVRETLLLFKMLHRAPMRQAIERRAETLWRSGIATAVCGSMILVSACSGDRLCTRDRRAGIGVTVLRAGDRIEICDAEVILRDGAFEQHIANCSESGAQERPGTYQIEVRHRDYVTRVIDGVVVRSDECHVILEKVEVVLEPIP